MDLIQEITRAGGGPWPGWPGLQETELLTWLEKVQDNMDEVVDRSTTYTAALERAKDFEGEEEINTDLINYDSLEQQVGRMEASGGVGLHNLDEAFQERRQTGTFPRPILNSAFATELAQAIHTAREESDGAGAPPRGLPTRATQQA